MRSRTEELARQLLSELDFRQLGIKREEYEKLPLGIQRALLAVARRMTGDTTAFSSLTRDLTFVDKRLFWKVVKAFRHKLPPVRREDVARATLERACEHLGVPLEEASRALDYLLDKHRKKLVMKSPAVMAACALALARPDVSYRGIAGACGCCEAIIGQTFRSLEPYAKLPPELVEQAVQEFMLGAEVLNIAEKHGVSPIRLARELRLRVFSKITRA